MGSASFPRQLFCLLGQKKHRLEMKRNLALRKVEISEQASSRQQSQPRADPLHKALGCSSHLEQLKSGQSHIEVGVACPFQPGWLSDSINKKTFN